MTELGERLNPHYIIAAYGIHNPYFVWMVSHGALDDIDPPRRWEHWTQTGLWADVAARTAPPPPRRNVYRTRPLNKRDAGDANSRRLFRSIFHRRLQDRPVLR